jgi:hypothetical protein
LQNAAFTKPRRPGEFSVRNRSNRLLAGILSALLLPAAGAAPRTGDPLAGLRRISGKTSVECNGALETVMLLALLASVGPAPTEFQAQARARFSLHANHPAVRETAALLQHGFGYAELAKFSTLMTSAPYFVLTESPELKELAKKLPSSDIEFNIDRLYGYAKLVREFYWDSQVGRFLRSSLSYYQQAARRTLPPDAPRGAKVLLSALAPLPASGRIEFTRRTPRPVAYLVVGR